MIQFSAFMVVFFVLARVLARRTGEGPGVARFMLIMAVMFAVIFVLSVVFLPGQSQQVSQG